MTSARLRNALAFALVATLGCGGSTEPGGPVQLRLDAGGSQSGTVGQPLPSEIIISVTDAGGRGVSGVSLTLATGGHGSVTPSTAVSNASGQVHATWTLGTVSSSAESLT